MSNHAKVLFFATLRDRAGVRETMIELPSGATIADIKTIIIAKFPELKQYMETIIVAMNHEFAFDEDSVPDEAEVALFPPVSGGEHADPKKPTLILITENEIDINSILDQITTETTGAACVFTGIVRGLTKRGNPRQTERLEYEAYRSMAETKMHQINEEIRNQWNEVEGIALVQRTGILDPGKISVIVVCTSSHRDSGIFEAARFGIDRLKEIVPIWKKEVSEDGTEWVEGDYYPQKGD